jgi:hypothetical protein
MTTLTITNIDQDAYTGILQKMENSFGVTFNNRELEGVSTFGSLCDIVTDKLTAGSIEERTRRQVFHKICHAITISQPVDRASIKPGTSLERLFPLAGRRQKIKAFQKALGIDVNMTVVNNALEWAIIIGAAISLLSLFFNPPAALTEMALTGLVILLSNRFGRELELTTVKQLTEKIAREYYNNEDCHPMPVDKAEVSELLEQLFVYDADFAPVLAGHDARMTG